MAWLKTGAAHTLYSGSLWQIQRAGCLLNLNGFWKVIDLGHFPYPYEVMRKNLKVFSYWFLSFIFKIFNNISYFRIRNLFLKSVLRQDIGKYLYIFNVYYRRKKNKWKVMMYHLQIDSKIVLIYHIFLT